MTSSRRPGAVLPQVVGELVAHQTDVGQHFIPRKGDGALPPDRDVLDRAQLRADALPAFRDRGAHRVQACLQRNPLPERDEQLVAARAQSIPCRCDLGVDRVGQAQNFRRRFALARQLRPLRPARGLAIEGREVLFDLAG